MWRIGCSYVENRPFYVENRLFLCGEYAILMWRIRPFLCGEYAILCGE